MNRTTIQDGPAGFDQLTLCGAGATSRVYRAVHTASGRVVALKRLHRQLVRSGDALARLRRELVALRQIRHPGIVTVYDVVDWQGDPTVVMEYVPGEDLKERVMREGRLSPAETERIGRALLDILAVTHASGIVHRDVKPQNVRLSPEGRVCLLDFGSARLDASSQLTKTGTTVGTPEYMAPELFAASVYDPRVDIYGLGATLYECLTGRPPQTADSLAELAFLRTTEDVAPVESAAAHTPKSLARVVDRCLAREPEDRYASAALALWALDNPKIEAAFAVRKSSHPPCLHCGTPLPVTSTSCARCHSDHPFAYAPGRCHVEISGLREPARFIEYVAARFPERARPAQLQALTERCAGLSFATQTYVAGIAEAEATRVKAELEAVGAAVSVAKGRNLAAFLMASVLVGAIASVRAGLFVFAASLLLRKVLLLARVPSSLLSTSRWPASLFPGLSAALLWGPVLGLLGLGGWLIPALRDPFVKSGPEKLALLAAAFVAGLVTLAVRFSRPALSAQQDPQPRLAEQLKELLWLERESPATAAPDSQKVHQDSRPATALLAVLGLAVVESLILGVAWHWVDGRDGRWSVMPVAPPPRQSEPAPASAPSAPVAAQRMRCPPGWSVDPYIGCVRDGGTPVASPRAWRNAVLYPFLPLPAFALVLFWRRQRVRKDGALLFADLDLSRFVAWAERNVPVRQRRQDRQPTRDLAALSTGDAFFTEALRRAADLAPCLPGDALARLAQTLEAVCKRIPAHREAERSLSARCILETDPEQKTRFDFLALEGQMEALAAQSWAAEMRSPVQKAAHG